MISFYEKNENGFMRGFGTQLFCFLMIFVLLALFHNQEALAELRKKAKPNFGLETNQGNEELTSLPINVYIDPDLTEITLVNRNSLPAFLEILAFDADGREIARWPLYDFSSPEGLELNLAEIFGDIIRDQIASVKVLVDEPFKVVSRDLAGTDVTCSTPDLADTSKTDNKRLGLMTSTGLSYPVDGLPGDSNCPSTSYSVVWGGKYWGDDRYRCKGSGGHPGFDIRVGSGTVVKAIAPGLVHTSKDSASWGGLIVIKHTNISNTNGPVWSIYAHLKRRDVQEGAPITMAGQPIGLSGGDKADPNHGNSFGPHLHFQIDKGATFVTPYFPAATEVFDSHLSASTYDPIAFLNNSGISSCNDTGEPNDSFSNPTSISCGNTISAKICNSSDVDYYKITPSSSGEMPITLNPPADIDYDLYVYNSNKQEIGRSTNSGGAQDSKTFSVVGGQTYYIKVVGYQGKSSTTLDYTLGISCPSPSYYSMSGTIHSGSNLGPFVPGATVSIAGKTAISGPLGTFLLTGIPSGTYAFSVSKSGYTTYTNSSYGVSSNQTVLNFFLVPQSTGSDTALQSGVSSSGSISSWQWKYYYVDVPSGASKLEIKIMGLTSDVDLYTSVNAKPTTASYTCRPYAVGVTPETCTYTNPTAGRWWAGIYGFSSGSYTITATVTTGTPSTYYSMSGTIHSGSNSGPVLSGVTVSIAGKTSTTGSTGTFSITGIPSGTYVFSVSKSGYAAYTNSAYLIGSNKTGLSFYLTQSTSTCPSGNGLYCGNSSLGQNSNYLYQCTNGTYTVSQQCSSGCQENASGQNDSCRSTSGTPGSISVSPSSGSWTSSPHNLSVSSSGATKIYYRMVNTFDGSAPTTPSDPSATANDGSFTGPTGTFSLYATTGQYKKTKLKFVGCNGSGCGPVSVAYSYTTDLRTSTSCPSGNGLYCGNSSLGQNSSYLYQCTNGTYTVSQQCSSGCQENASGQNDSCRSTSGTPGSISVSPSSGSWSSSPHNLSVNSSGATKIYYRMVNTYDGSTPSTPSNPSSSSYDGSITGPSGTFQLYASSGQYKKSRLKFVGCNSSGCGSVSGTFSYSTDLRSTTTCPSGNGYYCGSSSLGQNSNYLYSCSNGNYTLKTSCSNGCKVNPPGTNDACR